MLSNHFIFCLCLLLLLSILPNIRVFSNELTLHIRWSKCWSFSLSPSNEYSELISFSTDWFVLFAVQGTDKSCPQHHSWKASILFHSPFFMVQLSHLYMTTGKAIAFLPRSKCLLISWLQSPPAVILEHQDCSDVKNELRCSPYLTAGHVSCIERRGLKCRPRHQETRGSWEKGKEGRESKKEESAMRVESNSLKT